MSLIILAVAVASAVFPDKSRMNSAPAWIIDWIWFFILALSGILMADGIHSDVNPSWFPVGQDWREFVVLGLDIQSGGAYHPVPQRYPFYPWLAVQLANWTHGMR